MKKEFTLIELMCLAISTKPYWECPCCGCIEKELCCKAHRCVRCDSFAGYEAD